MIVYLDNSATTKQYEKVTSKMLHCMENEYGNPSSLHSMGLAAENVLKEARKSVGSATGFKTDEVFFTSGGTEAANLAVFGAANAGKRRGKKIITTAVEHPAVAESGKELSNMGFEVVHIKVDDKCRLNMDELRANIDENTILISVMHVNNEVGTIFPLEKISALKGGVILHSDAVQSLGKIPLESIGADILTVSAHKIHGPKGAGAIAVRKGVNMGAMLFGGGQEKNLRPGTENVPAIAGFGEAAGIAVLNLKDRAEKMASARKYLLGGIQTEITDVKINSLMETGNNGESGLCSPSILNVSFHGTRAEVILHGLESENIYVSTGAACSSNKKGKSRTLTAMGLADKEIDSALRFSFSEFNTIEEMDHVLFKLKEQVNRFRKLGSFR